VSFLAHCARLAEKWFHCQSAIYDLINFSTPILLSQRCRASDMIVVTMGKKQIQNFKGGWHDQGNIINQMFVAPSATRINQSRLLAEAHQIDSRILRRRQTAAAHLPQVLHNFHCRPRTLCPFHCVFLYYSFGYSYHKERF
jgi:hypothetical protein